MRIKKRLLIVVSVIILSACQGGNADKSLSLRQWVEVLTGFGSTTLNNEAQANEWLRVQMTPKPVPEGKSYEAEVSDLSETAASSFAINDRRLLRVEPSTSSFVFVVMKDKGSQPDLQDSQSDSEKPTSPRVQPFEMVMTDQERLRIIQSAMTRLSPRIQNAEPEIDLIQAEPQQIRYVGMMSTDDDSYGLVRVGSRVYRVIPEQRIGRGQWRIVKIESSRIHLMVDGRVKTYDK